MSLVPGTLIDRYRVEDELGRGGMARVYRVRHKNLGTLHALKVLTVSSEDLRARLLQEGRLQARLDHPSLVPVRDVLEGEDGPGLLMDFIDGPTLDGWVLRERPAPEERERVFLEILEGVAFAHAQGVVHRDLKPGNVLMERRRGVWHPRVADFGLAKVIGGEEDPDTGLSRTGRPMGTPAYMAPEQVRSAKHVDHRADVFALGCILYELVTGKRAFVGEDSLEVFNRVARGRFVPPRALLPELPARVEAAILGAMEVDLSARIPNAESLGAVLRGEMVWTARPHLADATMGMDDGEDAPPRSAPTMLLSGHDAPAPTPLAGPTAIPASAAAHAPEPAGAPTHAPAAASPTRTDPAHPGPTPPERQVDALPAETSPPARSRLRRPLAWAGVVALVAAGLAWGSRTPPAPPTSARPMTPAVKAPAPPTSTLPMTPTVTAPTVTAPTVTAPVPETSGPTSAAHPAPARENAPAPRGSRGTVRVSGDAREVMLRASDGTRLPPGEVPAGSYVLEARFDDGPPLHAGNVVVRPGVTHRVDCRAAMLGCNE